MVQGDLLWMKDFLQDDLYWLETDKISQVVTAIPTIEETPRTSFNCLGQPDSGFLILVHYPADEHMLPVHLTFLENILSRKGIKIEEITVLNIAKQTISDHASIVTYFNPQKILIMGVDSMPVGLTAPELNISTIINDVKLLYTLSFNEMDSDDKKRVFWNQMKSF